jgi:putative pyruvate formate lyase activating enzyme
MSNDQQPAYPDLRDSGELAARVKQAREMLRCCEICPRRCRVDRTQGELGECGVGSEAVVSSHGAHFGEESVLVGCRGSGTIFLTGCNLKCAFCQNYDISHLRRGRAVSTDGLAAMMLELQSVGCHNINFVSPTHQVPQLLDALVLAVEGGLSLPIVYNTGGYDSLDILRLLDGIVDIYMPDAKYGNNEPGKLYSGVPDYWDRCREALREMHRQVGNLDIRPVQCDGRAANIAVRGLLVRHLVLPHGLAHTAEVTQFLAQELSKDTYVNVMDQYRPEYRACDHPELSRRITREEYAQAVEEMRRAGIHRFAR